MTVDFADGLDWWKPGLRARSTASRSPAWLEARNPRRLARNTWRRRSLNEGQSARSGAEEIPEVGWRNSLPQLGWPAIQFEMAIAMSGMCKPTDGAMASLMLVIRPCLDRVTPSRKRVPDASHQKMAVLVDADHSSDETRRQSTSCNHIFSDLCLTETLNSVCGTWDALLLSTFDEAFADCALPTPPGPTPLWGPGSIPNNWQTCVDSSNLLALNVSGK